MKNLLILIFLLVTLSSYANCRFMMKCIDSKATCLAATTNLDATKKIVISESFVKANAKDIFLCEDSFGNYFERLYPSSILKNVSLKKEHYQYPLPQTIEEVDPNFLKSLRDETYVLCQDLAYVIEVSTYKCP